MKARIQWEDLNSYRGAVGLVIPDHAPGASGLKLELHPEPVYDFSPDEQHPIRVRNPDPSGLSWLDIRDCRRIVVPWIGPFSISQATEEVIDSTRCKGYFIIDWRWVEKGVTIQLAILNVGDLHIKHPTQIPPDWFFAGCPFIDWALEGDSLLPEAHQLHPAYHPHC